MIEQTCRYLLAAMLTLTAPVFAAAEQGIVNATGTVTERIRLWPDGALPYELARVRGADGRIFVADLGVPGGEATIQEGDRVVLSGRGLAIGDETLVLQPLISEVMSPQDREARRTRTERLVFAVLDDDADGALSRAEAMDLPGLSRRFGALDRDRDGCLSQREFTPAIAATLWNAPPS